LLDQVPDRSLFGLDDWRRGLYLHAFTDLTHLQSQVDAKGRTSVQFDIWNYRGAETDFGRPDFIIPWRNVSKVVFARLARSVSLGEICGGGCVWKPPPLESPLPWYP
jgi:hypothetical protein